MREPLYYVRVVVLLLLLVSGEESMAQYVKVSGVVTDSISGETLPFVNVVFKGKNVGTITDLNGKFMLETQWGSDVLQFSSMGYNSKEVRLSEKSNQQITIVLSPKTEMLHEVQIVSKKRRYRNKENPAVILIRNVIEHREENRGKTFDYYEYEKYEKSQYDVNNFTQSWLNSRSMKGFEILGNYIDTSDLNGKPFVPILIHEKLSNVYERNQSGDRKEIVTANRLSGFDDGAYTSGIDQFMSKIGGDVDVYDSPILLFDKSFTSPISALGPNVYRYYITDSTTIEGRKYTKLSFMPRNHSMIAFTGYMWVSDSTLNYGVRFIELNLDQRINVNFLDDMRVTQEFAHDTGIGWHLVRNKMIVDFQPVGRALGIFNTKTTVYSNFKVNEPKPDEFYNGLVDVTYLETEEMLTDTFWDNNRHEELSEAEKGVYVLTDTLRNIPQFKAAKSILNLLTTGYLQYKKIEIGPIASLVSYNTVEGARVRLGFITNEKFNKKWRFTAWGAYGFDDEKFKYQTQAEYYFNTKPFRRLSVSYLENIFQPGFAVTGISQDNVFLSIRRTAALNMFYVKNMQFVYDHEWRPGLINSLEVNLNDIESTRFNPMIYAVSGEVNERIIDNSITFRTRLSFNEKYIQGYFRRSVVKSPAPVFQFFYTYSSPAFGSDYEYHKFTLRAEKRFMLGLLGFTDVVVEGNKLLGKVPYPLLIVHPGNETVSYSMESYNLMNFMEFVSDQSVGVMAEHHFDGLLFGYLPLVNKSKVRLVVSGKFLMGNISAKNLDVNDSELILPPDRMGSLAGKPYVEGSIGVENIFRFFRVDLVKRFTYLEGTNIGGFMGVTGLAPRIAFKFKL